MRDFRDRLPTLVGRRKLSFEDGTVKYAVVEMADAATIEGTPLNRKAMMDLQGFHTVDTEFKSDGSIVETNDVGDTLTTTFPKGLISLEVFRPVDGIMCLSRKTYMVNGKVREEVLDGDLSVS